MRLIATAQIDTSLLPTDFSFTLTAGVYRLAESVDPGWVKFLVAPITRSMIVLQDAGILIRAHSEDVEDGHGNPTRTAFKILEMAHLSDENTLVKDIGWARSVEQSLMSIQLSLQNGVIKKEDTTLMGGSEYRYKEYRYKDYLLNNHIHSLYHAATIPVKKKFKSIVDQIPIL
jgi:hypothetical protein